ncbi:MAG: hypothetical protein IT429_21340 [Gemmataceae bacterium]|nr:hypothetical protein [Gemmataceae bacterium]
MYGKRLVPLLLLAALTATPPPGAGQPPKPPVLPPVAPNLARPDQTFQGLDGPGFAIAAGDAASTRLEPEVSGPNCCPSPKRQRGERRHLR